MRMKSTILVDEMNVIGQLHRIGIEGFKPWSSFYKGIETFFGFYAEKHFYCSNVPKELEVRFQKRNIFFGGLKLGGIKVHEGFSIYDYRKRLVEKGVDVMLGMDIYQFASDGVEDIVICSGDSDLVPAILRAKNHGARIHLVVSKSIPANTRILDAADQIIQLEDILLCMPSEDIILKNSKKQKLIKEGA